MSTVLVPSPVAMIKYFNKSTSGQTDSFQLTGHIIVYHGWEVTEQELEATGHIMSAIRREQRCLLVRLAFSILHIPGLNHSHEGSSPIN